MMKLAEAAKAIGARASGGDPTFTSVSTDSRSLAAGALFVAIRGERFDGHAFLDVAKQNGAVAAMVDEKFTGTSPLPLLHVDETRAGLGRLGAHWRSKFAPVLVAIAGSNGKTTTKEMLAAILRAHAGEEATLATKGNLNTDIGVPMTLLGLTAAHRYCALELGMNHPGEIAYLAGIAKPTVAVVTNAQREHQEFMKSVEAAAVENASAFEALPADGIACVNADDGHAAVFRRAAGSRKAIEFSLSGPAAITASYVLKPLSSDITIRLPSGEVKTSIAIPGLHNVRNALAAAAAGFAAGTAPAAIGKGLEAFRPYTGRHQVKTLKSGSTLIDDSYNANPDSVRAAIDVLSQLPAPRLLILGDMGEVGEDGPGYHREVGAYAREKGVERLIATGPATKDTVHSFGNGGRHMESVEAIAAGVGDARSILVKGSRFMRMERVVSLLTGEKAGGH